ncbi:hypothetical protein CDAR_542641, partial [Caerostris darwini]
AHQQTKEGKSLGQAPGRTRTPKSEKLQGCAGAQPRDRRGARVQAVRGAQRGQNTDISFKVAGRTQRQKSPLFFPLPVCWCAPRSPRPIFPLLRAPAPPYSFLTSAALRTTPDFQYSVPGCAPEQPYT